MRQVAARASVPPSTMTRLARSLDPGTYNDLRALYRDSINAGYPAKADQLQVVVSETSLDRMLDAFRQAALLNLNTLFDHIDRTAIDRVIQALTAARNILVIGVHSSYSFANYLHYVAAMGFHNWHLVERRNGEFSYLVEALAPADVVVAIALEPCAADIVRIARRARNCGARVVGITDRHASPLAACSDDVLLIPVQNPSFFLSYVGATALAEVLAGMVVANSGRPVVDNIDNLERLRREMGQYWQE